ncbi:MAG: esterase-like activity of phytase family protein [Candidatus Competibacteraceae bacterium]
MLFRCDRIFFLLLLLLGGLNSAACAGSSVQAVAVPLSQRVAVGDRYMGIRLLGVLRLPQATVNGLPLRELSGLAWDEDAGLLYAVSDKGMLFHLRPVFSDDRLSDVELITAYPLQGTDGRPLRGAFADAEGLAIINGNNGIPGDSQLVISFEERVRIARYSPDGRWLQDEPLPSPLQNSSAYANPNLALESVTIDPQWGLLTAPERPLRGEAPGSVPIYAQNGRRWLYPLHSAPASSLVAMEALPDGSLLTLERAFVSLLRPFVISLRRTRLLADQTLLKVENVAVFDTSEGWLLDNFEGLTRQRGRRFLMVSDDNTNPLQSTLLVYFELLPEPGEKPW